MTKHFKVCHIQGRFTLIWHAELLTRVSYNWMYVNVVGVANTGKQMVFDLMTQTSGEVIPEHAS